jgi:L-alanine-DL-glutamate epimerase-like enolase superfamily enzyme
MVESKVNYDGGEMRVPNGPGLGVELDREKIRP